MVEPLSSFQIADREVGINQPPYCIAEVGINHNGDLDLAYKMIDAAKEAGADAVKFQTFQAEELCGDPNQMFTYKSQGKEVTESMLTMFRRYQFDQTVWSRIESYSEKIGITFFSTPQNVSDLRILEEIGVPAIKVGSDDLTNTPQLKTFAQSKLPIILSTGMSDIAEVHKALEAVGWFHGSSVAVLLCTSLYPTPPDEVHALRIKTLQRAFPGLPIGFSDHTEGPEAAIVAAALGATIFEKHFTLDQNFPGPDHWFSETPATLKRWVESIRVAVKMLGRPYARPTQSELGNKQEFQRYVVAIEHINAGDVFSNQNIAIRRAPGGGEFNPEMFEKLLGKVAWQNFEKFSAIGLA